MNLWHLRHNLLPPRFHTAPFYENHSGHSVLCKCSRGDRFPLPQGPSLELCFHSQKSRRLVSLISPILSTRSSIPGRYSQEGQLGKAENKRTTMTFGPVCSQNRHSTLGKTSPEDLGLTFLPWPLIEWECHLRKSDLPRPVLSWAQGFCSREKGSNLNEELQAWPEGDWLHLEQTVENSLLKGIVESQFKNDVAPGTRKYQSGLKFNKGKQGKIHPVKVFWGL